MKPHISEFHPDLQKMAGRIPSFNFSRKNLWLIRFLTNLQPAPKIPMDLSIENSFIPGPDQGTRIRLRIYRPKSSTGMAPALLWLHGGGYIIGKPEQDDACCIQYVRQLGIVIASVDYRCAPEHPFPTPLEDGYAALQWLAGHAGQLGLDPTRIAIGGGSAGAGLAAALAQLACDRKEIKPVFQLLVYSMLDDRTCLRTDLNKRGYLAWSFISNCFGWESYLGKKYGADLLPPYSVPSRRPDLSGLPPAWIGVGTLDLFHDEDAAYAQRLKDCGVACELVVVPGAFHGFDVMAPQAQVVQDFRKSQLDALKRYLF